METKIRILRGEEDQLVVELNGNEDMKEKILASIRNLGELNTWEIFLKESTHVKSMEVKDVDKEKAELREPNVERETISVRDLDEPKNMEKSSDAKAKPKKVKKLPSFARLAIIFSVVFIAVDTLVTLFQYGTAGLDLFYVFTLCEYVLLIMGIFGLFGIMKKAFIDIPREMKKDEESEKQSTGQSAKKNVLKKESLSQKQKAKAVKKEHVKSKEGKGLDEI